MILAFFYGQSRIFFTVARDGLLPSSLARVSRRGTPVRITIFTAVVTSVFAGLIPLAAIAALANAGTLAAFIAVCAAMLVLAPREPEPRAEVPRPAAWVVGACRNLGCLYLFISLPNRTQLFFVTAQAVGLVLYVIYGSRAAQRARTGPSALEKAFELLAKLAQRHPAPVHARTRDFDPAAREIVGRNPLRAGATSGRERASSG